jgi:hypothetical protein
MADPVIIFPNELTIPLPRRIQYGNGITATSGPHGVHIIYRGLRTEREKLHKAAGYLGLSYGCFMRCLVNDVADLIIKMHDEKQDTGTSLNGAAQD